MVGFYYFPVVSHLHSVFSTGRLMLGPRFVYILYSADLQDHVSERGRRRQFRASADDIATVPTYTVVTTTHLPFCDWITVSRKSAAGCL